MKKLCIVFLGLFLFIILLSAIVALLSDDGISIGEKIALLYIRGPILDAKPSVDELKKYIKDSAVKAIVLRVDSPGGGVAASQEIYHEVKRAASLKEVVVSMGSVAASGGYYVSAPATKIVANPGTITGSIGVIMEIPNVERLMDKVGIKTDVIKSGKHKDMASAFRKMDEADRSILQGVIDDVHEQFVRDVAESRNIPIEEVWQMADGRIYTGRQALELRLVDELGSLEDAIKLSAELAGIEGEPVVVTPEKKFSWYDLLEGKFSTKLSEMFPHMKVKYILYP